MDDVDGTVGDLRSALALAFAPLLDDADAQRYARELREPHQKGVGPTMVPIAVVYSAMLNFANVRLFRDPRGVPILRELVRKMLEGFAVYGNSWNGAEHEREPEEAMVIACGGDELLGRFLYLASHYDNDMIELGEDLGIRLKYDVPGLGLMTQDAFDDWQCEADVAEVMASRQIVCDMTDEETRQRILERAESTLEQAREQETQA